MAGQGCQIPGPQAHALNPHLAVRGAQMRTGWGLGFETELERGWGDFKRSVVFPAGRVSPSKAGGEFGPCPSPKE